MNGSDMSGRYSHSNSRISAYVSCLPITPTVLWAMEKVQVNGLVSTRMLLQEPSFQATWKLCKACPSTSNRLDLVFTCFRCSFMACVLTQCPHRPHTAYQFINIWFYSLNKYYVTIMGGHWKIKKILQRKKILGFSSNSGLKEEINISSHFSQCIHLLLNTYMLVVVKVAENF